MSSLRLFEVCSSRQRINGCRLTLKSAGVLSLKILSLQCQRPQFPSCRLKTAWPKAFPPHSVAKTTLLARAAQQAAALTVPTQHALFPEATLRLVVPILDLLLATTRLCASITGLGAGGIVTRPPIVPSSRPGRTRRTPKRPGD